MNSDKGHLSLTVEVEETVFVGEDIEVKLIKASRGKAQLVFSAPKNVVILREKLKNQAARKE